MEDMVFYQNLVFELSLVKEMFLFGGWNLVGTSSTMVSNYGIGIVINRFFGTIINATQNICNQFTGIMLVLSTNLMKAVNPVIVKSEGSGNREKMFDATFKSCKLSYLTYSFIGIPFFLECNSILNIWLSEVPPYCLEYCQLVFILKLIEQLTTPLNTSISAVGKIRLYNIVISIIQLFQIGLVVAFFMCGFKPFFSVIAMIIAAFCCSVFKIFYCYKNLSMELGPFMEIVGRCCSHLILCVAFGVCVIYLFRDSLGRLISVILLSFTMNVFIGYYILLNTKEKALAVSVLLGLKKNVQSYIKHD